ncbi:hypothetical protein Q3051_004373, partial [Vibrio vulnificus]|nr:hypothetical protein [Vibrio vulnificus]
MPDFNPQIVIDFVIPLAFVAVGVFANRLGRQDGDSTPKKNYYAVGTTVFVMSLATILAEVKITSSGSIEGSFGWISIYLLCVLVSIDIDRYSSWKRCPQGLPTNEKHVWRGIVLPNTLG